MYEPLHRHRPSHRWTNGDLAARVMADLGLPPDEEQQWLLDTIHAERAPDRPASFEVAVVGPRQNIKALAWDTPILTWDRGFVRIVDLNVGDRVVHPSGRPTDIVGVSQLMFGDCYRVTTTDGRSLVADADHLWTVTDKCRERSKGPSAARVRHFEQRVMTTKEIASAGTSRYLSGGRTSITAGKSYPTNEYRFVLPRQQAIKSPNVDLPLDPYLLGAWLGDGTSVSGSLTCAEQDVEHWVKHFSRDGFIPTANRHTDRAVTIGITTPRGPGRQTRSFAAHLRRAGVLGNKNVPEQYLTSGARQREALLQGLLDTDGTIDTRRGQVSFCSTNLNLAEGVLYLARSLGWRPTLTFGRALLNGRDCGPKFTVTFTPKISDDYLPFRLDRKLSRMLAEDGGKGRLTLSIKSVEPVESVPVLCIKVAAPDGLYLAGRDLLPTHNTSTLGGAALADLFVFGVERHLWTAHHGDTLANTFTDFKGWITSNPDYDDQVQFYEGHQDMSIVHKGTGNVIDFQSRTGKAGRGLTGVKRITLDEALFLEPKHVGAVYPTMLTRPGAQVRIASSAGFEFSAQLRRIRDRGRAGKDARLAYVEYGAERKPCLRTSCSHDVGAEGCALDDRDLWWQANPALWSGRISEEALADQRNSVPPEEFMREFLSWWEDPIAEGGLYDAETLDRCDDPPSQVVGKPILALSLTPDGRTASLAAAGTRPDGRMHLEIVLHGPSEGLFGDPAQPLASEIADIAARHGCPVALHPGHAAGSLLESLQRLKVALLTVTGTDYSAGCTALDREIRADAVRWPSPQPELLAALRRASLKQSGEASKWAGADISALVAATQAAHEVRKAPIGGKGRVIALG